VLPPNGDGVHAPRLAASTPRLDRFFLTDALDLAHHEQEQEGGDDAVGTDKIQACALTARDRDDVPEHDGCHNASDVTDTVKIEPAKPTASRGAVSLTTAHVPAPAAIPLP
jgi:hypothetical protein